MGKPNIPLYRRRASEFNLGAGVRSGALPQPRFTAAQPEGGARRGRVPGLGCARRQTCLDTNVEAAGRSAQCRKLSAVGRTPWSAADAPVGLVVVPISIIHQRESGSRGTRADRA